MDLQFAHVSCVEKAGQVNIPILYMLFFLKNIDIMLRICQPNAYELFLDWSVVVTPLKYLSQIHFFEKAWDNLSMIIKTMLVKSHIIV